MSLYFQIILFSILVPLLLSFDKNLKFYKKWKTVLPSIFIVGFIYILFDIFLTQKGVWGFNPSYHSSIKIFGLPLEEILFFFAIPYASIFLHETINYYFEKHKLTHQASTVISLILLVVFILLALTNFNKAYTFYISIKGILLMLLILLFRPKFIQSFFITFLIILIPFLITNGILTGTFIEQEVVWYNNNEILGVRILTIPIEDVIYAFTLIAFSLFMSEKLYKNKIY